MRVLLPASAALCMRPFYVTSPSYQPLLQISYPIKLQAVHSCFIALMTTWFVESVPAVGCASRHIPFRAMGTASSVCARLHQLKRLLLAYIDRLKAWHVQHRTFHVGHAGARAHRDHLCEAVSVSMSSAGCHLYYAIFRVEEGLAHWAGLGALCSMPSLFISAQHSSTLLVDSFHALRLRLDYRRRD